MAIQDNKIKVVLTVSSGMQTVYMPKIVNKDYREANLLLEGFQLDLDIRLEPKYNDDVTAGYVIEQFPEVGTELKKGSTVYITYSKGPETVYVDVPDVMGLSKSNAVLRLESYGLSVTVEEVDNNAPKGEVVFQSYEKGTSVPTGTSVVIRVSKGPATVEPSPTPEPEPTPTPDPAPTPED